MTGGYRALEALRKAGDIAAFGIGVNETEVSLRALDRGAWDVFLLAGRYTLLEQTALDPFFTRCAERKVSVVIGGPFNSGILVGGETWNYAKAPSNIVERVNGIKRICAEHHVPLPAAALQFPLAILSSRASFPERAPSRSSASFFHGGRPRFRLDFGTI